MSEKKVLREKHGVTLIEVTLHGGVGAVISRAYVIKSKRTPEAPNFADLPPAEAAFAADVKKVSAE
jgi:hypothetical protein